MRPRQPWAALRRGENPRSEPRRQQRAHLLDAGLEEFGHRERLTRLGADFRGDARHAGGIDLGLCHPDHVLVGHAHREMPCGLAQQASIGARALISGLDWREPVEIAAPVGRVLIRDQAPYAFACDLLHGRRQCRDGALEVRERWRASVLARHGSVRRRCQVARLLRGSKTAAEALQVALDRLAVGADRVLERRRRDRHAATARDQAEHDRVDHRARLSGERLHVEDQMLLRVRGDRFGDARAVVAAIAHRHLFRHQVGAAGGRDHQCAIGRDEAGGDGAAGFQQFTGDHDVHVADPWRER